jgi:hypothetical protein
MTRSFTTFTLSPDLVSVAFPLVNAAIPTVDLATWQRFVQPMTNADLVGSEGVIGLRNEAGYLCGLMVYRIDRDLKNGVTLAVDLLVALDLVNVIAAGRALLQAAEAKALELHCSGIHIRLGSEQKALADCLNAGGYRPSANLYCKKVAPPMAN